MNIFPLNIKNLNYMSKDKKILKDINLITSEKKITIIAGNNGSGKSTLLKILHGIIQHTSGTINWGEIPAHEVRKKQSMVFQNPILLNRTTFENIMYVAKIKNIETNESVDKIIKQLNLESIINIESKYLSGGEKQKVAIAMSIISNPKIIFLDEPTSQLDPVYKNEIENIITNLSEKNTKIFMTSHDIAQIDRIGKEIIFLDDGEIIFHDKVKDFINEKGNSIIRNYVNYG
tara:strand:- start:4863 stop:5558 length:696 start_codon:yes stop_codon:yes gene_type:complete